MNEGTRNRVFQEFKRLDKDMKGKITSDGQYSRINPLSPESPKNNLFYLSFWSLWLALETVEQVTVWLVY